MANLTDLNRNMMLSIDILSVPTDEAVREVENRLLPVEVMEDTQPVSGIQFHALGAEGGEAGGQVGPDPGGAVPHPPQGAGRDTHSMRLAGRHF